MELDSGTFTVFTEVRLAQIVELSECNLVSSARKQTQADIGRDSFNVCLCLLPENWIARLWSLCHLREAGGHSEGLVSRMRSSAMHARPNSHRSVMWSGCFHPHSLAS